MAIDAGAVIDAAIDAGEEGIDGGVAVMDAGEAEADASPRGAGAPACGGQRCTATQFCEDRYKGHAVDDEGRPLARKRCMPLPRACRDAPSCACVRRTIAATRCRMIGGQVFLDDYPR